MENNPLAQHSTAAAAVLNDDDDDVNIELTGTCYGTFRRSIEKDIEEELEKWQRIA